MDYISINVNKSLSLMSRNIKYWDTIFLNCSVATKASILWLSFSSFFANLQVWLRKYHCFTIIRQSKILSQSFRKFIFTQTQMKHPTDTQASFVWKKKLYCGRLAIKLFTFDQKNEFVLYTPRALLYEKSHRDSVCDNKHVGN